MRKWTEQSALSAIHRDSYETNKKFITSSKSKASGLKTCSAIDYLVNHCGYKFNG